MGGCPGDGKIELSHGKWVSMNLNSCQSLQLFFFKFPILVELKWGRKETPKPVGVQIRIAGFNKVYKKTRDNGETRDLLCEGRHCAVS